MVQGWATRPVTLTGTPWRMAAEGAPGTLTASRSADPSPMEQLDDVQGLAVLVGPWPLGLEVDHRLGGQGTQERDGRGVDRELHGLPP